MADVVILLVVIALVWTLYIQSIVMAARRPDYAYRAIGRTKPGTVVMNQTVAPDRGPMVMRTWTGLRLRAPVRTGARPRRCPGF